MSNPSLQSHPSPTEKTIEASGHPHSVLTCQSLTPELLPAVLEIDELCLGGLWTEAAYRREIESPNSDLLVLMLEDTANSHTGAPPLPRSPAPSAHLLGFACLWSILDEAHITTLAIHPHHQRLKLGQWLLTQLLGSARTRQLTHATLEVRASNAVALGLYQKFGFQIAGRRRRYYSDNEDALILWRSKLQTAAFEQALHTLRLESEQVIQQHGWHVFNEGFLAVKVSDPSG